MTMKKIVLSMGLLASACGYSSKDNELIGQVKKVKMATPIICPDFAETDVSLGIIRNGVGSMSSEDVWLFVEKDSDLALLKSASESGQPVKIKYNVQRVTFCVPNEQVSSVELVK
jgi:hypothetical protein